MSRRDALRPLSLGYFIDAVETELPAAAKISYIGAEEDKRQAVAESRRFVGASGRVAQAELPIVLDDEHALAITDSWLQESGVARERAQFALAPCHLVTFDLD